MIGATEVRVHHSLAGLAVITRRMLSDKRMTTTTATEAHRHDCGRDAGHRRRAYELGHDQEVDQGTDYDIRCNLPHRDVREHSPSGLKQFSPHLRQVIWPHNFKLEKLKKYDGKENLENWITLYEIVVRSATRDEHVMANYFPVVLDQADHQWLLGLPENSFDSWEELRQAFIDNFIATYEQPGNKHDLERIWDRKNEPLRDYIR
jgi:hypothetical protein